MPAGVSAYVPLANVTLATAVQTVVFSSISQSYRDLVVVFNGQNVATGSLAIILNNDGSSSYSLVSMAGNGSSTLSNSSSFTAALLFGQSAGINSGQAIVATANIMDYTATDKHKTVLCRGNAAGQLVEAGVSRYASTSAITQITVLNVAANLAVGSTIGLYGVSA